MTSTTILALFLTTLLAIVHMVALKLSLYWEIGWLDNAMHFFGGIVLALLFYTLVDIKVLKRRWVTAWRRSAILIMTVLLGWEVLGVLMVMDFKENFVSDTTADLIFGIMGSIIGWFIGRQLKKL